MSWGFVWPSCGGYPWRTLGTSGGGLDRNRRTILGGDEHHAASPRVNDVRIFRQLPLLSAFYQKPGPLTKLKEAQMAEEVAEVGEIEGSPASQPPAWHHFRVQPPTQQRPEQKLDVSEAFWLRPWQAPGISPDRRRSR